MITEQDKAQVASALSQVLTSGGMEQDDADQIARGVVDQAASRQGR